MHERKVCESKQTNIIPGDDDQDDNDDDIE